MNYCNVHKISLRHSDGWCPACQAVKEDLAASRAMGEVAKWLERAERDKRYPDRYSDAMGMARDAHEEMYQAKQRSKQCRDSFESLILMGARQEPCPNDNEPRREQARVELDDARTTMVCGR